MLSIEYMVAPGVTHRTIWHYGEPLPEGVSLARVLKIDADGDELEFLLEAIRASIKPVKTIDVPECDDCKNHVPLVADGYHVPSSGTFRKCLTKG